MPFLLLLFFLVSPSVAAQDRSVPTRQGDSFDRQGDSFDLFVDRMYDLADELPDEEWDEELMDELYELYCHPLNLNDLNEEQLSALPFLTPVQAGDILDYAEHHRPVLSTGELMAIPSLDYPTRRLLLLFLYAGDVPAEQQGLRQLWERSRNDLTLRCDVPFYTRMGFADYPASVLAKSPNKAFRGSQPYLSARYMLESMNHVEAGFQLEKDPGEGSVDYWSAYAVVRDLGCLHTLAVGDYRLSFGHGLVVNTSTGFGKTMMLSGLQQTDRGIRRHSSMNESDYLSGAAATLHLGRHTCLSAFVSKRHVDGTPLSDGTGISSLKTDGLHRTLSEYARRGNLGKTDYGGNLAWQGERLRLSLTAVHTHFSLPLRPQHDTAASRYRLYNAAGTDFTAFSLAYRYVARMFSFSGETASTADGGMATLGILQGEWSKHRLTLIGRYYSHKFVSINGKTFSDNSRPQNESGVYAGWQRSFSRKLTVEAYADWMYFPWLKYQVSQSSYALETMASLSYTPHERHTLSLRYRMKTKQMDWKRDGTLMPDLLLHTHNSLRLTHQWEASGTFRLKTSIYGTFFHRADRGSTRGWALCEHLSWHKPSWLHLSLALSYFHTDDYSSRIYIYEPSLLYSFGMSALYEHGMRAALLATLHLPHRMDILAKFGSTHFFNRSSIGSGVNEIPQSHREDLQLQLHWRF